MTSVSLTELFGCGPEGAPDAGPDGSVDGGVDGDVDAADLVTPPDIPWLAEGVPPIMLAPCPEGWREVHGSAVTECDPYPEDGAEACGEGEAHFPGEAACRPVGDPCPAGDYATSLPTGGSVIYVNVGAPASGDGSLTAPFQSLSEVPWATLTAGTTVALGKGTYPGVLRLAAGVTAFGACAQDTVVTGLGPAEASAVATVTGAGEAAVVENMTLRGALHFGVVVERGRRLNLRGVVIDGMRGLGVYVSGAGADASLVDVVVRDTEAIGARTTESGVGIYADLGASLDATRLVVDGNRQFGIHATGAVQVTLTDAVVQDTDPGTVDSINGSGLFAAEGARCEVARSLFSGNHRVGIVASGMGSSVALTDVIVRDTGARAGDVSDGSLGVGVVVGAGAQLLATRFLVAHNRRSAVLVDGAGAEARFEDAVIRDPGPLAQGRSDGRGVQVRGGGRLEALRMLVSGAKDVAVLLVDPGTVMSVRDVVFQETEPEPVTRRDGAGVAVQEGARFEASRLLLSDHHSVGLVASHEGTFVDLVDVVVRDIHPQVSDQRFGRGMHAQSGAHIQGVRVTLERTIAVAVASVTGASVALSDVTVRGVAVSDCAATSCPTDTLGYGAGASAGSISLTRFQIIDATTCGVLVSSGPEGEPGSLDLEAGIVAGAEIGACVQVDGYDLERLTNDVVYRDNGTNLDATTLPTPGVIGALEE